MSSPDLPPAVQWLIIVVLATGSWWAITRWINKLDKILEKLDTAVDGIHQTLVKFEGRFENHDDRITILEGKRRIK